MTLPAQDPLEMALARDGSGWLNIAVSVVSDSVSDGDSKTAHVEIGIIDDGLRALDPVAQLGHEHSDGHAVNP